jgi:cold shock CspA family protein
MIDPQREVLRGVVIMFDAVKRFGFIRPIDRPDLPNLYAHYSDILGPKANRFLHAGEIVEFTLARVRSRRIHAAMVRKLYSAETGRKSE